MRIFQVPRQCGKTSYLLATMRANPDAIMVVMNAREKDRLQRDNPDLKDRLYSFSDYRSRHLQCPPKCILVDNLDLILHSYLGSPVAVATINSEVSP